MGDNTYNYAMEMCQGGELFEYIKTLHSEGALASWTRRQTKLPQKPLKEANEWIKVVQHMFWQVASCTAWFHSKRVCHLDMSLENAMIGKNSKKTGVEIKIIDFGVAKLYENGKFEANKPVGKTGYMAPEVYNKKKHDPRAADIWSIGVMLFMMLIGAPPYQIPQRSNPAFNFIVKGRLGDVLKHWKRLGCVTEDALDLMNRIFKYEPERIKMEQLLAHPFLKEQAAMHSAEMKASAVKVNSANAEEKGDSADKLPDKERVVNEATAKESANENAHEAGQVMSTQDDSEKSQLIGTELDYAFKSDAAKEYAARLQGDPPAEELSSMKSAVEQETKDIEEQLRNQQSQEQSEYQQKVDELRRIHKVVERRLEAGQGHSKKTVEPRQSLQTH